MNRLALIGVSHRRGGAEALEAWQQAFTQLDAPPGFSDWVPIITCNRWDVVTYLPEGISLASARQYLTPKGETTRPYAFLGDAALEQLTRIAASLDSLNPGEDQIMKQVREAFVLAQTQNQVGPVTTFAFNTALRIAKRVRREVALAPMHTSLFSLARPALAATLPSGGRVAVIGAGDMGSLAAKTLAALPDFKLIIVNRSFERAEKLARQVNAVALSLHDFLAAPPDLEALICATPSYHLISPELSHKLPNLKCIIDMGVPRNVHPEVARDITTLDIDTLQAAGAERRKELHDKLAQAEGIMHEELESALNEWTERQLGPSIKNLRDWYLATIAETLAPEEAGQLAHKFAHIPIKGLRAIAREYGLDAAKLFLKETGLEL